MNSLTRIFLVLLRLAIGWHFLLEGIEKIQSVSTGPTETNRPWTSEPYLREASGPLAAFVRLQVGDPDQAILDRLTLKPLLPGQDPARTVPASRFPAALERDWDSYFERFVKHYNVGSPSGEVKEAPVGGQLGVARKKVEQNKDQVVMWLLHGNKKVKKSFPSGTVEIEETTAQRIASFQKKLEDLRAMEKVELPAFERDVLKDKYRVAKAELASLRREFVGELGERFNEMKHALQDVLTGEQKESKPLPDTATSSQIEWIDLITRYGLTAVGLCLILGLFTRSACIGGAAFLLVFYLTMPPFPGVPENLRVEGHYLFVNKNLIEMLALLALATTRSGRWLGLDGVLQFLNPLHNRSRLGSDAG
jgi:uncharacterized membrane protein YphA (DoxX/SURF4 family)